MTSIIPYSHYYWVGGPPNLNPLRGSGMDLDKATRWCLLGVEMSYSLNALHWVIYGIL